MIELHFEADSNIDADELYDMLYQMAQRVKNAGDASKVSMEIPSNLKLVDVKLPDDAVYLPE